MTGQASTIFALSSGQGVAGVAIIRVSGSRARVAVEAMADSLPPARVATRRLLKDPQSGAVLDDALVIWFPGPKSFTGEDIVEFHVHGGRAVVAGVLDALGQLPDTRLAEPGEFTRRAFENGKIDLTEAEGLADLIQAETEAQRRQALRQLSGELHRTAEVWRGQLVRAQALVEAAIDFSDEADVSDRAVDDAHSVARPTLGEMEAALADAHRGEILRDGFLVVIAGPPNVGKSSLINAIARREAAIVSAEPGTTRDIVELQLNLGGLAVILADTAGLRDPAGHIEREGIRRGLERASSADMVLWVMDATAPDPLLPPQLQDLEPVTLRVLNKSDLMGEPAAAVLGVKYDLAISTRTGDGLAALERKIGDAARRRTRDGEPSLITAARHRQHIQAAREAIEDFLAGPRDDLELRAEDLRRAAQAIGRLVGRVDAEEILGEIFGRFCIGK